MYKSRKILCSTLAAVAIATAGCRLGSGKPEPNDRLEENRIPPLVAGPKVGSDIDYAPMIGGDIATDLPKEFNCIMLYGPDVSDATLERLKGRSTLRYLGLHSLILTDAGLEHLKGMKNLEGLILDNTNVTAKEVRMLQEALPKCKIRHKESGSAVFWKLGRVAGGWLPSFR